MLPKGVPGIYRIRNLVNNKVYVGSTSNLRQRFFEHRSDLRCRTHYNPHLLQSWGKHGEAAFVFEPLVLLGPSDSLVEYEQVALDAYPAYLRYNLGSCAIPPKGRIWSQQSREKQRQNRLGKRASQEARARMASASTGRRHSEETKSKMRDRSPHLKFYVVTKPDGSEVRVAGTYAAADLIGRTRSTIQNAVKYGAETNGHRIRVVE